MTKLSTSHLPHQDDSNVLMQYYRPKPITAFIIYFLAFAASAAFFSSDSLCFCLIISACLRKTQVSQSPCMKYIRFFLLGGLAFALICFSCLFQRLCAVSIPLVATYHE